jgi:hypothetical protein
LTGLAFSIVLLCTGILCDTPRAEDAPAAQPSPNDRRDEIVVTGRRLLRTLKKEFELAQDDLYKAYNANNSDDELDIHCRREVPINSHISRRVCRPVFVDTATSRAGRDFTASILGPLAEGSSGIGGLAAQESLGNLKYMTRRLDEEMQRLMRENAEVAKAAAKYREKERAYQEALAGRK